MNNTTPNHEFVELDNNDLLTIEGGNALIKCLHEMIEKFDFDDKKSKNVASNRRG